MRKLLKRYGSINVPITGAGVILYGLILIAAPHSSFMARVYRDGPFAMAPKITWGIAFVIAGTFAIALRASWAVLPLLVTVCGWTIAVVIASVTVDGVAPTAGIGWAIICTQLLTSVSLRGTNHHSYVAGRRGWRR